MRLIPSSRTSSPDAETARRAERGSALIVALMIMIILTLLGVTFLVMSESEQKISVADRDHSQTLYMAEAAVGVARTWFNDPTAANAFLPTTAQLNRTLREGRIFGTDTTPYTNAMENDPALRQNSSQVDGDGGALYTGGNITGSTVLFDKPYRGTFGNTLWGRRDTPDVLACADANLDVDGDGTADCSAAMATYMNNLNDALRMATALRDDGHSSRDFGNIEVEQIQIYRPPLDYDLKLRYGICTIEATAVKRMGGRVIARRTVRDVLQEIPFPGPDGAIETEGGVTFSGSQEVHWGSIVSSSLTGDVDSRITGGNAADPGFPRSAATRWGVHGTFNPASRRNYRSAGNPTQGPPVATALSEMLGITKSGTQDATPGAPEVLDPWLLFRARNNLNPNGGSSNAQPWPWEAPLSGNPGDGGALERTDPKNRSNRWQKQVVRFPVMDYQTWKDISRSGAPGMYYLRHAGGQNFQMGGAGGAAPWIDFADRTNGAQPGVYFYDTEDSSPPNAGLTNLTDALGWSAGAYIEGFFYLNSEGFVSQGSGGGPDVNVAAPGEPYMDDGIDLKESGSDVGDNCICIRYDETLGCLLGLRPIGYRVMGGPDPWRVQQCDGYQDYGGDGCKCSQLALDHINETADRKAVASREAQTFRNLAWDADLDNDGQPDTTAPAYTRTDAPWIQFVASNAGTDNPGGGHGYANGVLPHYSAARRLEQGANNDDWKRDPRFLNHLSDFGGANSQRQPHEEFLNLNYKPTQGNNVGAWPNGQDGWGVFLDYDAHGDVNKQDSAGAPIGWTTRARDADGELYELSIDINGVMYSEGDYGGSGNIKVYGSMLMRQAFDATGSLEVWFNEGLIKGQFPDARWGLPRVYTTSRDVN